MTQPLFFSNKNEFVKEAGYTVSLPDDPNQWPQQLQDELYKQAPFIAHYDVHVNMNQVDAEQGFGIGVVEVRNKSDLPESASEDLRAVVGLNSVRIPVIVVSRKLQPFDVMLVGSGDETKTVPLTDARMRQALFRPQVGDVTSKMPGDQSLVQTLFPPFRSMYGFGGQGMFLGNSVKMASEHAEDRYATLSDHHLDALGLHGDNRENFKKSWPALRKHMKDDERNAFYSKFQKADESFVKSASSSTILASILPTIAPTDYGRFLYELSSDTKIANAFATNPAASAAMQALSLYNPDMAVEAEKVATENAVGTLMPTVIQLTKLASGYRIKTASHKMWSPTTIDLDRGQAIKLTSAAMVKAADEAGSITAITGEDTAPVEDTGKAEVITKPGLYKVKSCDGNEMLGYVFPKLIDTDGNPVPIALFTNGAKGSVQGEIAGIQAGSAQTLPTGTIPRGEGVFYRDGVEGELEATIPFSIKTSMNIGNGNQYIGSTYDGRPVRLTISGNVKKITSSGMDVLVPDSYQWVSFDKVDIDALMSKPDDYIKTAALIGSKVDIRSDGTYVSLRGFPLEKLGNTDFLSMDDAVFYLGGMGVSPVHVFEKIGQAILSNKPVSVHIGRHLNMVEDVQQKLASRNAQVNNSVAHLRRFLVKEAAEIPDPTSVDAVLSLGFLNPSNLGVYVEHLPTLDEAVVKMCSMLISARLGQSTLPVPALEKAIRSTEEVIQALHIMAVKAMPASLARK